MKLQKGFRSNKITTYEEMAVIGANGEPPFYYMQMTANVNFGGFSSKYKPGTEGLLVFQQDATGGRTVNFGAHISFVGVSGLQLDPNAINIIEVTKLPSGQWIGFIRGGRDTNSAFVQRLGDTMQSGANITFVGGGTVKGLPIPTADTDAASKVYVDQNSKFYGFRLSADKSQLYMDYGSDVNFNVADYVSWFLGPRYTFSVVNNSLVATLS